MDNLTRRAALLAIFSLPFGDFRALQAQGAILTVDLNQWKAVRIQFGKETITLPTFDIFAAIKGDDV